MTLSLRRTAAATALLLAPALGLSLAGAPAQAADLDLGPIFKADGAKVLACKKPVQGGDAFRIYARLDNTANRRADARSGVLLVTNSRGRQVDRFATKMTPGGKVSERGSVVIPTKGGFTLGVGISSGQSGNGTDVRLRRVPAC